MGSNPFWPTTFMIVTIQLVTEDSFASKLIRYFTNSEFSHVDLVMPDGGLLGARLDGGVQIRPDNYAKFTKLARFNIDLPADTAAKLFIFATAQVGKKYDSSGIINFFTQNRNWREDDSWFCSELIAAAFEHAGYPLFNPFVVAERITPRDLTLTPKLNLIQ
jgi:uncharacterized protein YycO